MSQILQTDLKFNSKRYIYQAEYFIMDTEGHDEGHYSTAVKRKDKLFFKSNDATMSKLCVPLYI